MASELSPDKDAFLEKLIAIGQFSNRQQALDHAIDLLRDEVETVAAIREGLESVERGEGIPLEDAVRQLREKCNIPNAK
jgi:predicted transcriptional regulator